MIIKRLPNPDLELYHHGVEGQKWGVRHGPPYPIEDKVLKKGTVLNSVRVTNTKGNDSEQYRNSGRWMYTYNPNNKWDNKVYKGPFSVYKLQSTGKRYVQEYQYMVVDDLKMPTKKERMDNFKNLYNDKKFKNTMVKELNNACRLLIHYRVGNNKELQSYKNMYGKFNNIKTEDDWKTAYSIFNHMMENTSSFKSTKKYSENMSKKYDAMVDDNNQGSYNRAQDPVIIFRANKALQSIGNVSVVEVNDIIKNYNDVKKELNKHGENIKL